MEEHHGACIDVVERLKLWEKDAEPVKKTNRIGKPWDVVVEEKWWNDEHAGDVVDKEGLLANVVPAIHDILDGHIVDVVGASEEEEESGEMIGPEMFVDLGMQVAVDAGDDEGQDEDNVAVDPYVVGEEVMIVPIDALEHVVIYQMLQKYQYLHISLLDELLVTKLARMTFYFIDLIHIETTIVIIYLSLMSRLWGYFGWYMICCLR